MLAHMLHPMPMLSIHDALHSAAIHDALHSAAHMNNRLSLVDPHVTESDTAFTIAAEAPGVAPADVKIEFESQSNSVRIHGRSTSSHTHTHFVDFTTCFGTRAVDADKATASVEDGIITIMMPKAPDSESEVPSHVQVPVSGKADDEASSAGDDVYRLTLVTAGFNASEIAVEAQANAQPHRKQQDGLLRISGESTRIKRKRLDEVYRLPRDADYTGVTASQVDGILTICIPRRLAPAARRIPIAVEAAGGRRKLPETAEAGSSPTAAPKGSDETEEPVMV